MANVEEVFINQLKAIADEYDGYAKRSQYSDVSEVLTNSDISRIQTKAIAAIERVASRQSVYYEQAISKIDHKRNSSAGILGNIIGVLKTLCSDLEAGHLRTFAEIVHSDLFSDYLEMAQHLMENGYKDAAAVIAGSTLEAHLKQLALKFGVEVEGGNGKSKKADTVNADLVKAGAYNKLDQKNVTAWLDLRNKAAHGEYEGYSNDQVQLLLENIRNFITRNPA